MLATINSSVTAGLFDAIKSVFKILTNFPNIFMGLFKSLVAYIYTIFYYLFMGVAYIMNFGEALFKKFAGLDTLMTNDGKTADIVTIFISSNEVWGIFVSILVLSIILLFLFTFIAIIKSEFSLDVKGSAKGPIIARALKSLAMFIIVPTVSVMGVYAVNALTQTINGMFRNGDNVSLSNQIFYVSAYGANRARLDPNFRTYISGGRVKGTIDSYSLGANTKNRNGGVFNNEDSVAYEIDIAFRGNMPMGGAQWVNLNFDSRVDSGLELDCLLGLCPYDWNATSYSPWHIGAVNYYFDLTQFDYILGLATSVYMAFLLVFMTGALIKRVFELTILLLLAPPLIAMGPLDGGNAAKKWQGEFVKRVICIIGPVFAINMYFVLVPVFMSITIFNPTSFIGASSSSMMGATNVYTALSMFTGGGSKANGLAQILALIVGMQIVKQSSALLGNLLGMEDLVKSSGEASKKAVDMAAKVATTVATGGAAVGAMFQKSSAKQDLKESQQNFDRLSNDPNAKQEDVLAAKAQLAKSKESFDHAKDLAKDKRGEFFEQAAPSVYKGVKATKDVVKNAGKTKADKQKDDTKKAKKAERAALAELDDDAAQKERQQIAVDEMISSGGEQFKNAQKAYTDANNNYNSRRDDLRNARSEHRNAVRDRDALVSRDPVTGAEIHGAGYDAADARVGVAATALGEAERKVDSARTDRDQKRQDLDQLEAVRVFASQLVTGDIKAGATVPETPTGDMTPEEAARRNAEIQAATFAQAGTAKRQQAEAENTRETNIKKKVQEAMEQKEAEARIEAATLDATLDDADAKIDRNGLADAVQQGIEEAMSALRSAIKDAIQSGKLDVKGIAEIKAKIDKQAQDAAKAKSKGDNANDIAQALAEGFKQIADSIKPNSN